jgi:putrescine aminotransferase
MREVDGSRRVIVRGQGSHVWTEDGRRALDLPAGLFFCAVGHGRARIAEAVAEQLRQLASYSNFQQYATRPALELAERLAAVAPMPEPKVLLMSNGSDAVDTAAKLARRYWTAIGRPEKRLLVARDDGYHGMHGFGTGLGGIQRNREGFGDLVGGIEHVPWDDGRSLETLLTEAAGEVAAVFCEPIMGTGGVLLPPDGYLQFVQDLCRRHDVLLVVDEVITGFGRAGTLFASELYGLQPDLLLFAKGVTSGYVPLGGLLVGQRVAEPFWSGSSPVVFRHGLTYQGHAAACAAALENLDIIKEEGLVQRVADLAPVLDRAVRPLAQHPAVVEVRCGVGLLAGVKLESAGLATRVVERCWDRGILTRLLGHGDVLHISPPFVIDEADIVGAGALIAQAIAQATDELTAPAHG